MIIISIQSSMIHQFNWWPISLMGWIAHVYCSDLPLTLDDQDSSINYPQSGYGCLILEWNAGHPLEPGRNVDLDSDCLVSHCSGPGSVLGGLLILFWVSILPIHLTWRISESDYTFDFLSRSHKTSISIFSHKYFTFLYLHGFCHYPPPLRHKILIQSSQPKLECPWHSLWHHEQGSWPLLHAGKETLSIVNVSKNKLVFGADCRGKKVNEWGDIFSRCCDFLIDHLKESWMGKGQLYNVSKHLMPCSYYLSTSMKFTTWCCKFHWGG